MRFGKYLENEKINFIHLNLMLICSYRITVMCLHLQIRNRLCYYHLSLFKADLINSFK